MVKKLKLEKPAKHAAARAVEQTAGDVAVLERPLPEMGQTKGLHVFSLADSTASYTYTDGDVTTVRTLFAAMKEVDKAAGAAANSVVRIFGDAWTKEGADAKLRTPIRDWLWQVLPEAAKLRSDQAKYKAASSAGITDVAEAATLRARLGGINVKITAMLAACASAWRNHQAAQDSNFTPSVSGKGKPKETNGILDNITASLEKRVRADKGDAPLAKASIGIISQLQAGRAALFQAVMQAGARLQAKDDDLILFLRFVDPKVYHAELIRAQAESK